MLPNSDAATLHSTNTTHHIGVPLLLLPGFVHFDGSEFLRYLAFVILMMVTIFFSWIIPAGIRYIIRDFLKWEIRITDDRIKRQLLSVAFLQKQHQTGGAAGPNPISATRGSAADTILDMEGVDDNYRLKYHGITGYLRKNVFMILYTILRLGIFCLGTWLSFSVVGQDLILVISSFGVIGLISAFQLFEYFRCFLAFCWIVCTGSIKEGDYVMVGGESGVVSDMGFVHTILKEVNPAFEQLELDESQIQRLIKNKNAVTDGSLPFLSAGGPVAGIPASIALFNAMQNPSNYPTGTVPSNDQSRQQPGTRQTGGGRWWPRDTSTQAMEKHKPYVEPLIYIQIPNWWLTAQGVRIKHQ